MSDAMIEQAHQRLERERREGANTGDPTGNMLAEMTRQSGPAVFFMLGLIIARYYILETRDYLKRWKQSDMNKLMSALTPEKLEFFKDNLPDLAIHGEATKAETVMHYTKAFHRNVGAASAQSVKEKLIDDKARTVEHGEDEVTVLMGSLLDIEATLKQKLDEGYDDATQKDLKSRLEDAQMMKKALTEFPELSGSINRLLSLYRNYKELEPPINDDQRLFAVRDAVSSLKSTYENLRSNFDSFFGSTSEDGVFADIHEELKKCESSDEVDRLSALKAFRKTQQKTLRGLHESIVDSRNASKTTNLLKDKSSEAVVKLREKQHVVDSLQDVLSRVDNHLERARQKNERSIQLDNDFLTFLLLNPEIRKKSFPSLDSLDKFSKDADSELFEKALKDPVGLLSRHLDSESFSLFAQRLNFSQEELVKLRTELTTQVANESAEIRSAQRELSTTLSTSAITKLTGAILPLSFKDEDQAKVLNALTHVKTWMDAIKNEEYITEDSEPDENEKVKPQEVKRCENVLRICDNFLNGSLKVALETSDDFKESLSDLKNKNEALLKKFQDDQVSHSELLNSISATLKEASLEDLETKEDVAYAFNAIDQLFSVFFDENSESLSQQFFGAHTDEEKTELNDIRSFIQDPDLEDVEQLKKAKDYLKNFQNADLSVLFSDADLNNLTEDQEIILEGLRNTIFNVCSYKYSRDLNNAYDKFSANLADPNKIRDLLREFLPEYAKSSTSKPEVLEKLRKLCNDGSLASADIEKIMPISDIVKLIAQWHYSSERLEGSILADKIFPDQLAVVPDSKSLDSTLAFTKSLLNDKRFEALSNDLRNAKLDPDKFAQFMKLMNVYNASRAMKEKRATAPLLAKLLHLGHFERDPDTNKLKWKNQTTIDSNLQDAQNKLIQFMIDNNFTCLLPEGLDSAKALEWHKTATLESKDLNLNWMSNLNDFDYIFTGTLTQNVLNSIETSGLSEDDCARLHRILTTDMIPQNDRMAACEFLQKAIDHFAGSSTAGSTNSCIELLKFAKDTIEVTGMLPSAISRENASVGSAQFEKRFEAVEKEFLSVMRNAPAAWWFLERDYNKVPREARVFVMLPILKAINSNNGTTMNDISKHLEDLIKNHGGIEDLIRREDSFNQVQSLMEEMQAKQEQKAKFVL